MYFNSSSEKSGHLHYDGIFLPKVCNVLAKIMQTSCVVKKRLMVPKITLGIWRILTRAVKNLKTCSLMGCFCQKYVMFELK